MGEKRSQKVAAIVLDAGALIAFEKGDPRMRELIRQANDSKVTLVIPTAVVAQVLRDKRKQVSLGSLLSHAITQTPVLTLALAESVGALCAARNTSDIVDAVVVLVAKQYGSKVVTSDVHDLSHLDSSLDLVPI
jgi:predicted nucleic acid-binding protein